MNIIHILYKIIYINNNIYKLLLNIIIQLFYYNI